MKTEVYFDYTHLGYHTYRVKNERYGKHYKVEPQNINAFDIETNNGYRTDDGVAHPYDWDVALKNHKFYEKCKPVSIMWVWQCAVEDLGDLDTIPVYMGRTWDDFKNFVSYYVDTLKLAAAGRDTTMQEPFRTHLLQTIKKSDLVVRFYIHNLGFEFQYLRNVFEQELTAETASVFARQARKPMRVRFHYHGAEVILCDTLCLTQKSLKAWGKDENLEIKKIDEDQDFYQELRTPYTKLSQKEIDYSVNDVATMVCGVRKYRDKYKSLRSIPMTQTGCVRLVCYEKIARANTTWSEKCAEITREMTWDFYTMLHESFVGGWTHANAKYFNRKLKRLIMKDFRSSYPAVMCTRTYPIEKFEETTYDDIKTLWNQDINHRTHHYIIEFSTVDVESKTLNTFWSKSKCKEIEGGIYDNGKIYAADMMHTTMIDLDFERFSQVYEHGDITVHKVMKAKAGRLPKQFVETILDYYAYKTSLKGDVTAESLYAESKQFINSIYGVCVTKIVTDIISFMYKWGKRKAGEAEYYEAIDQQLKKNMFTTYQIGVWVTGWARHNLWDAIFQMDSRVVYCDTDSIKGLFTPEDEKWLDDYNQEIWKLCEEAASDLGIDVEKYRPKTKKGAYKELGFFDDEGVADEFKTLGAKRYVYTQDGHLTCTIAGIGKKSAASEIHTVDDFTLETEWDVKTSGKLACHYCEEQPETIWRDRDGNKYVSHERYGIVLEPASFSMSISDDYEIFLEMIDSGELSEYFEEPEIFR